MEQIEDLIKRADEISGGKFTPGMNLALLQAECLDKILLAIFPEQTPLVSIGPSGIGGEYQREING